MSWPEDCGDRLRRWAVNLLVLPGFPQPGLIAQRRSVMQAIGDELRGPVAVSATQTGNNQCVLP